MNKQLIYKIVLYTVVCFAAHMHGYYSGRGRGYAMGLVHAICEIHLKQSVDDCPIYFDTWQGKVLNR